MIKTLSIRIILLLAVLGGICSCSSSEWEGIPDPIAEFLTEYFPQEGVSKYGYNGETYHVKLRNSVAISFDDQYKWVSVNGYGNTLPEMFLFDELPPALYSYLQELSLLDGVYSVTRDAFTYNVTLLDSSLTYTISTGVVTPDARAGSLLSSVYLQKRS